MLAVSITLKGKPYILAVKVFLSSPPGFDIVALMRWFSIITVLLFVFGKVPLRSVIVALRAFIEKLMLHLAFRHEAQDKTCS